jgi:hypothetical protein
MKSIIQQKADRCYICHKRPDYWGLDKHHIFGGAYRDKSEKYGLTVFICHNECHLNGVHKNAKLSRALKQHGQKKAMEHYGWDIEQFKKLFGKNYMED